MLNLDLLLILLVLVAGVSIVWTTLKVGISPMPSAHKAREAMFLMTDKTAEGSIYDLGSGWGHLVIRLAKRYPQRKIVGYELSLLPWLTSVLLKKMFNLSNLTLHRTNFINADLSKATVLVCYLHREAMALIKEKLDQETGGASYLISHNFALPSSSPYQTVKVSDFYQSPVYLYKLNDLDAKA